MRLSLAAHGSEDPSIVTTENPLADSPDLPIATPPALFRWRPEFAVFVALVFVLYGSTVWYPFLHYDDNVLIAQNHGLYPFQWSNFAGFWTDGYAGVYMPVTYTYWTVMAHVAVVFGDPTAETVLAAWPFHFGNVLLFLTASLLVFQLLERLTASRLDSFCGTVIFIVHPLQIESVAWVSEAKGLLALTFGLAALVLYVHVAQEGNAWTRAARRRFLAASTTLYILAMLSKPSAVSSPLIAGVLSLTLLPTGTLRRSRGWLGAWIVLGILVASLANRVQSQYLPTSIGLAERPWVAAEAAASYLRMLLVPVPLAAEYGRHPLSIGGAPLTTWQWQLLWAVVGVLWIARLRASRRANLAAIGIAAAGVAPVLGLAPFGFQEIAIVADRYATFALVGLSLAVAESTKARRSIRAYGEVLLAAIVLCLLTWVGVQAWKDDKALIAAVLRHNPLSRVFRTNRAVLSLQAGKADEAVADLRRAAEIEPVFLPACQNLAVALYRSGDPTGALAALDRGLVRSPENSNLLGKKAEILSLLGQWDTAVATMQTMVRCHPSDRQAKLRLAGTLVLAGRESEALTLYRATLERSFHPPEDEFLMAQVLLAAGQDSRSLEKYRSIVNRWGPMTSAYRSMAWIAATSPDEEIRNPVLAKQWIDRVIQKEGVDSPQTLDVLAAVQAAAGDFEHAVATAEKAVQLAGKLGDKGLALAIERRLAGYRDANPFRRERSLRLEALPQ